MMPIKTSLTALILSLMFHSNISSSTPLLNVDPGFHFEASSPWYMSSAVQLGLHRIDRPRGEFDLSSIGQGFNFSVGRPVAPIISMEAVLNFWFTDEEDESPVDHALLHDFHFSGISIGLNTILHVPSIQGPYAKIGRHCWAASIYETLNIWDGIGCSNLFGGGIYFGSSGDGYYMEISRIRFERVKSWFMTAGIRF